MAEGLGRNLWMKKRIMMNRRVLTAMVLGVSMLSVGAVYAAPVGAYAPANAASTKEKPVSLSFHNNTGEAIKIKAGASEMTVDPGKTVAVKLAVGEKVVAQSDSPNYHMGDVLATATKEFDNAVITLN
jgi:hypothetical protein